MRQSIASKTNTNLFENRYFSSYTWLFNSFYCYLFVSQLHTFSNNLTHKRRKQKKFHAHTTNLEYLYARRQLVWILISFLLLLLVFLLLYACFICFLSVFVCFECSLAGELFFVFFFNYFNFKFIRIITLINAQMSSKATFTISQR